MRVFASRILDARHTIEGKILSVLLSVLLVASLFNVAIFTSKAIADVKEEELDDVTIEQVEVVEDQEEKIPDVDKKEEAQPEKQPGTSSFPEFSPDLEGGDAGEPKTHEDLQWDASDPVADLTFENLRNENFMRENYPEFVKTIGESWNFRVYKYDVAQGQEVLNYHNNAIGDKPENKGRDHRFYPSNNNIEGLNTAQNCNDNVKIETIGKVGDETVVLHSYYDNSQNKVVYELFWIHLVGSDPVKTYTVTYKDGVNGAVFADDKHDDLALDDPTPKLSDTIELKRTDFEFDGWSPAVTATVTDDAVYTALWRPSNKSYTVEKSHTIANAQDIAKEKAEVGDTITYTVTVKSTGNAETDEIVLKDQLTGGDPFKIEIPANSKITQAEDGSLVITVGKLPAGAKSTFTYSYVIQATDKQLKNEVFVGEEKKTEDTVYVEDYGAYELKKTVKGLEDGSVYDLDKDTEGNALAAVGDVLKYTIEVTNTGNIDIANLTVKDTFQGKGNLKDENGETVALNEGAFDVVFSRVPVNQSSTVIYTYVVLANDTTVSNAVKTDDKADEANVIVKKNLSYEKSKSAVVWRDSERIADGDKAQVGDVIKYEVVVKNTGNVATDEMIVTDDFTGDVDALLEANSGVLRQDLESGKIVFTVKPIEVDGTEKITYSYKIQPTDKWVSNAIGVEDNQKVEIEVEDTPAYEISKVATLNSVVLDDNSTVKAGDKINYRLTVTNTGNTAVNAIALEDVMTVDGKQVDLPANVWWSEENDDVVQRDGNQITIVALEKGASLSVWYDYEVKATDSKISNALKSGDEKPPVVVETGVDDNPAYGISKTASVSTKGENGDILMRELSSVDQVKVGDTITYTLKVENTGNAKLQNINLTDLMKVNDNPVDLPAAITGLKPHYVIRDGNNITVTNLNKGQSYEVSYSYTVDAKDASVSNVLVSGEMEDGIDLTVEENEAISVSKSFTIWRNDVRVAEAENSGQVKVGDEIRYQVSLANEGNTDLDEVIVKDSMENASRSFTNVKGATWDEASKSFIVKWTSSTSYSTITYNYTVQREDVGKVLANVAAVGENEDQSSSASTKVEPEFTLTGVIDHGTVSIPKQKLLADETSKAIEFAAAPGYRIVKVNVNGESIELDGLEDENGAILDYVFESTTIKEDTRIEVVTADINAIGFTAPDVTETYNSEVVWYGFESVMVTNLPTGYSATGQVMGSRTNVGTTVTTIENIVILDGNGKDVTEHFAGSIETIPGSITITPAQVTIRVNDANKIAGQADPVFSGYVEDPKDFYSELGDITYARTTNDEGVGVYTDAITAVCDMTNQNFEVDVVPGTFTIIAGPAPIVPAAVVPGAPAPVPGVAAPAPEEITDDATPMAQSPEGEEEGEEEIADDENPLGAFDVKHCWTHWMMLLGILLTAAYGIAVARRRSTFTNDLDDFEKSITGESRKVRSTVTVRTGSHQAI